MDAEVPPLYDSFSYFFFLSFFNFWYLKLFIMISAWQMRIILSQKQMMNNSFLEICELFFSIMKYLVSVVVRKNWQNKGNKQKNKTIEQVVSKSAREEQLLNNWKEAWKKTVFCCFREVDGSWKLWVLFLSIYHKPFFSINYFKMLKMGMSFPTDCLMWKWARSQCIPLPVHFCLSKENSCVRFTQLYRT